MQANKQVEGWVLGALLDADGPTLRTTAAQLLELTGLVPEDFSDAAMRGSFAGVQALAARGRVADADTVATVCKGLQALPHEALCALRGGNEANREALVAHADELRRLSRLRQLAAFHQGQLEALCKPRPDPVTLAAELEAFTGSFAADAETDEMADTDAVQLMEDWDAARLGLREPLLKTGIRVLDDVDNFGGFVPNLNVIGGMESVGKSALVAEMVMAWLQRGLRVGFFGLEDATRWLTRRHMARALGLPLSRVGTLPVATSTLERAQEEAGRLSALLRNMVVYRRPGIEPHQLVAKARRWVLKHGVQVLVVDHGGEVRHESTGAKDRYDLAVANSYRMLRDLAVNHQVPVVVLAHFNTECGPEGPNANQLAETKYIARMARTALGLWEKDGRLVCTVMKRTEGKRGVHLWLERDTQCALVKADAGGVMLLEKPAPKGKGVSLVGPRARLPGESHE